MRAYGRKPRSFSPHVPHYSAVRMRRFGGTIDIPSSRTWSKGMPDNLGMMLNDQLGCCVVAGAYHLLQAQSFITTGNMDTQPDSMVLQVYKQFGYVEGDASTDNGINMQDFLKWWYQNGLPLADGTTEKLLAYFEVDPTNQTHLREVLNDCGGVYLGINLPQAVEDNNYPPYWDYAPGGDVAGGHCVGGYDFGIGTDSRFTQDGMTIQTWGEWDRVSPQTEGYYEEAYALVTDRWVKATGITPLGMSLDELDAQMDGIKE